MPCGFREDIGELFRGRNVLVPRVILFHCHSLSHSRPVAVLLINFTVEIHQPVEWQPYRCPVRRHCPQVLDEYNIADKLFNITTERYRPSKPYSQRIISVGGQKASHSMSRTCIDLTINSFRIKNLAKSVGDEFKSLNCMEMLNPSPSPSLEYPTVGSPVKYGSTEDLCSSENPRAAGRHGHGSR